MNKSLILRLPQKNKFLIYAQIIWVLIMLWLRDEIGLPSMITYLTDIFTVCLFFSQFNTVRANVKKSNVAVQSKILLAILICILIGDILNLVSPVLILWAIRNNMRFFVFFYICVGLLELWDIDGVVSVLFKFFWANIILCSFQYFFVGLSGDQLGGFFGTTTGSNTYMNILMCSVLSISIGKKFAGKIGNVRLIIYIVACLYIAVLAEIKAFYLELIIIIVTSLWLEGFSWKQLFFALFSMAVVYVAFVAVNEFDSSSFLLLLDRDALEAYLFGEGYTQKGDLNRLSAIRQIHSMFFKGKPLLTMFGLGFGNCEISQFDMFCSPFARQYAYLHYRWFTHSWVFIEQGAIGLILLFLFFISIFIYNLKIKKRNQIRKEMYIASGCFVLTCIFGMIYNCALQLESCYMIAFMCAIPFIEYRHNNLHSR